MSITGALFSGVSGLKAEAQSLSIISDNISNANTVGYKASSDAFETLITQPPTNTEYTPGGVIGHPVSNVTAQGLLQASSSATDTGINGNGFFITTDQLSSTNTATATGDRNFTRAGSFTVDANGNLVNTAGQYLLAIPTNTSGVPTQDTPSLTNLSVANVGGLTGDAAGTTELSLGANLPATPTPNTPLKIYGAFGTAGQVTLPDVVVYSADGQAFNATVKTVYNAAVVGPPAVAANMAVEITALTNIQTGTTPAGFTSPTTIGSITEVGTTGTYQYSAGTTINVAGTTSATATDTLLPTLDVSGFGGSNTPGAIAVDPNDVVSTVYDSLGVAENLTLEFSRAQDGTSATTLSNTQLKWAVSVAGFSIAGTNAQATTLPAAGGTSTTFPINLDGSSFTKGEAAPAGSTLSFNTDGSLASGAPTTIPGFAMVTGASAFGGTDFTLNLGTANSLNGLTSFSNAYALSFSDQNGIAYGFRTGVQFTSTGLIEVTFSNGQSVPVYKIPLATFANEDALEPKTGNIYTASAESGTAVLNYPSVGGTGSISPSTLESSTTDIATEFTNMIVTQRSYSANARTITTADEMLQQLLAIKQ
jgi:flagellar hook protein FlgE